MQIKAWPDTLTPLLERPQLERVTLGRAGEGAEGRDPSPMVGPEDGEATGDSGGSAHTVWPLHSSALTREKRKRVPYTDPRTSARCGLPRNGRTLGATWTSAGR